ncbi:hypothetical protein P3S67_010402 [Capsicum chacoense]
MDRVDFAIQEEIIDFKNLLTNFVNRYIKVGNVVDMVDPTTLEEHGVEIQQQLEDFFDPLKRCTSSKGEDRQYMIHVAKELRRIEKCSMPLLLVRTKFKCTSPMFNFENWKKRTRRREEEKKRRSSPVYILGSNFK